MTGTLQTAVVMMEASEMSNSVKSRYFFRNSQGLTCLMTFRMD
jgi:hypothetical protein